MATKQFSLEWVFDPLINLDSFFTKRIFGGLAAYAHDQLMLVIFEDNDTDTWKGTKFKFPLWNGVLICTDFPHHQYLMSEFPTLMNHPVLKKWLYLKANDNNFESLALSLTELALQDSHLIGVYPKEKKKAKNRAKAAKKSPGRRSPKIENL